MEIMRDDFFNKKYCDRCGGDLPVRIMSWFTEETICLDCSEEEKKIKAKLRERGEDTRDYEGCGYIPKV